MKENTINGAAEKIPVAIIGGGIVGAGLFRDLALHGVPCLLIDRGDFASQTSQWSSKMLHGGIRYLENADLALVWEALHEKNLWLKLAPHLCQDRPFYLPAFKNSKYPLWMNRIGLFLYDALSAFKNTPHQILNKKKTLEAVPGLKNEGLSGCGVYHDVIVDDAKLTLENIYDGLKEDKSFALNYVEMTDIQPTQGGFQLKLKDRLTQKERTIISQHVIFATGPFTDQLLGRFPFLKWKNQLLPSQGSHLWIKGSALPLSEPLVIQTNDQRIIFLIPQKGMVLVGTTEREVQQDLFNPLCAADEKQYLIDCVQEYFPKISIKDEDILSTLAGIRPLVKGGQMSLGKTSRRHKELEILPHLHVIIGGKLTTFRTMGQKIAGKVCQDLNFSYDPDFTARPFRQHSLVCPFEDKPLTADLILNIARQEHPRTFEDLIKRRLGVPARQHWRGPDFNSFFTPLVGELNKIFPIEACDVINWK
ncbi:MAG: glycerol-3-phosphate dehydrogenase/oxidase [Pseudomonadota bacterium]